MKKKIFIFNVLVLLIITSFNNPQNKMENIDIDFLLGKYNPSRYNNFIEIPINYASSRHMYIQEEVLDSFIVMYNSAKSDGIDLKIVSATRSFYRQKEIWEDKWEKYKNMSEYNRVLEILKYSSMPGTSRHHWGTDIDINSFSVEYFKSGNGLKEYLWLDKNAIKFGFCQPYKYKDIGKRTGYEDEPWHWSYSPLSKEYLQLYKTHISYEDINGFEGCNIAKEIDIINNYVLGIDTLLCY
jgi:LAS superfamily LD-carboxypeptidase LdcB